MFDEKNVSEENRKKLWGYYNNKLSKGVDEGFSNLEFDDSEIVKSLKKDVAKFSAFKETSFKNDLEKLLIKDDRLVPWSEFKKDAYKLSGDYNGTWLETEYHHTVANANMAQKWKEFERDVDLYPNLKLVSVNDGRVRPEHKVLDGTIRPFNDPFWNTHTPPLDWGCRCDIEQTDEDPTEIPGGFQTKIEFENNSGKTGTIFGGSAYEERLTVSEVKEAEKNAKKWSKKAEMSTGKDKTPYNSPLYKKRKKEFEKYKNDENYQDVELNENGGLKATHILHNQNPKTINVEQKVQNLFFKNGDKFTLENESSEIAGKKIDGFLNEFTHDVSAINGSGKNTIKRAMNHAREKKADITILYFPEASEFSMDRLEESLRMYNGQTDYRFKKIIYIVDDIINYY